jgi:acetyl-CoA synthetase
MSDDVKTYPPAPQVTARAHVKGMDAYRQLYERARENPEQFWSQLATTELDWFEPFKKGLTWNPPHVKWFEGGSLNACFNCVDRHAAGARKQKPALIWEGEPGDSRVITYEELHRLVTRFGAVLKQLGFRK